MARKHTRVSPIALLPFTRLPAWRWNRRDTLTLLFLIAAGLTYSAWLLLGSPAPASQATLTPLRPSATSAGCAVTTITYPVTLAANGASVSTSTGLLDFPTLLAQPLTPACPQRRIDFDAALRTAGVPWARNCLTVRVGPNQTPPPPATTRDVVALPVVPVEGVCQFAYATGSPAQVLCQLTINPYDGNALYCVATHRP